MRTLRSRPGAAAFLTAVAALLALLPSPSEAAARICERLEAELASIEDGSPRLQEYDDEIIGQQEEIAAMRDQADEAGCGYALRGESVRQCARLNARLERMELDLEMLQRKLSRTASRTEKSRRQLLSKLEANGCQVDQWPAERPPEEFKSENAFPEYDPPYEDYDADRMVRQGEPLSYEEYNQVFRTMCVRTCDGFFFPMSNAATIGDFERDQKGCEAACPGTEVSLFFGPAGSEGAADMTSVSTGRPYSELPTAFLHQKISSPRPAACGCKAKKDYEVLAGTTRPTILNRSAQDPRAETAQSPTKPNEEASAPAEMRSSIVAVPLPEAAASSNKPAEEAVAPGDAGKAKASNPEPNPAGRKVRVVGPAFLPDQ